MSRTCVLRRYFAEFVCCCELSFNPDKVPSDVSGFDPSLLDEQTQAPRLQKSLGSCVAGTFLIHCRGSTSLGRGPVPLKKIKTEEDSLCAPFPQVWPSADF